MGPGMFDGVVQMLWVMAAVIFGLGVLIGWWLT
jgi:hypothetical protein